MHTRKNARLSLAADQAAEREAKASKTPRNTQRNRRSIETIMVPNTSNPRAVCQ